MVVHGGVIYLGGDFSSIAGLSIAATARRAVAAVGVDGVLRSWAPALDGPAGATLLRRLLPLGATIYLGGDFTSVNGALRLGFGAVDAATGELVQPELYTLGGTRIHGLATDGSQMFVAGVSFGAPLVGSASIPGSVLAPYGPTGGVVPTSAAYVAGRLYAGREYDPEAAAPTGRTTDWAEVFADTSGLLHLPAAGGVEYYAARARQPAGPAGADLDGRRQHRPAVVDGEPHRRRADRLHAVCGIAARACTTSARSTSAPRRPSPRRSPTAPITSRSWPATASAPGPPSNEATVQVGPPPCTVAPTAPGPLTVTTAGAAVSLQWGASPTAAAYILDAGSVPGAADLGSFPLSNATSIVVGGAARHLLRAGARGERVRRQPAVERGDRGRRRQRAAAPGADRPRRRPSSATRWRSPGRRRPSGGTPSGYRLEAGYAPGLANAAVLNTTAPAFAAAGVPPGTYYVRVRAFNAAGAGPATPDIVVTVP